MLLMISSLPMMTELVLSPPSMTWVQTGHTRLVQLSAQPRVLGKTKCTKNKKHNSFLFLVVRPGAPPSVLAPSSDARSP